MPDLTLLALAGLAVLLGALVQGLAGFGLGVVAAPVLTLLLPDLVPAVLIALGAVLPVLSLARERAHADWRGFGWAFGGRVVGTAGGVALVGALSVDGLSVVVGVVVLGAVALSLRAVHIPRTRASLVGAGVVSGVTGTATSVGGPPIALVYQQAPGPQIRATLALFLGAGATLSFGALAVTGHVGVEHLVAWAVLLPFLGLGFALSSPLRRHVDGARTRPAVLAVATVSALTLLARALA